MDSPGARPAGGQSGMPGMMGGMLLSVDGICMPVSSAGSARGTGTVSGRASRASCRARPRAGRRMRSFLPGRAVQLVVQRAGPAVAAFDGVDEFVDGLGGDLRDRERPVVRPADVRCVCHGCCFPLAVVSPYPW